MFDLLLGRWRRRTDRGRGLRRWTRYGDRHTARYRDLARNLPLLRRHDGYRYLLGD